MIATLIKSKLADDVSIAKLLFKKKKKDWRLLIIHCLVPHVPPAEIKADVT